MTKPKFHYHVITDRGEKDVIGPSPQAALRDVCYEFGEMEDYWKYKRNIENCVYRLSDKPVEESAKECRGQKEIQKGLRRDIFADGRGASPFISKSWKRYYEKKGLK